MKEVVIVSAARTPIGSFGKGLSTISAPKLGAIAIISGLLMMTANVFVISPFVDGQIADGVSDHATASCTHNVYNDGGSAADQACLSLCVFGDLA